MLKWLLTRKGTAFVAPAPDTSQFAGTALISILLAFAGNEQRMRENTIPAVREQVKVSFSTNLLIPAFRINSLLAAAGIFTTAKQLNISAAFSVLYPPLGSQEHFLYPRLSAA